MTIQYQYANPWPIHQPNANLGTNHPSTYLRPISQTMTKPWAICQSLANQTNQCLYSDNLTIYQSITNGLSILGQSITNVPIQSQSLRNPSVQRQGPHLNCQTNLSVQLIKTLSARIGAESSANSGLIIQSNPNPQSWTYPPIHCQYSNNLPIQCTRVSAFREILQSLQCKIVQYTFLGQYVIKLWDFFSQCKIPHPAWLQLDHNKLGLSGMRLCRPHYHKIKKTLFQMCCTALKNINQGIYWVLNVSG